MTINITGMILGAGFLAVYLWEHRSKKPCYSCKHLVWRNRTEIEGDDDCPLYGTGTVVPKQCRKWEKYDGK